MKGIGNDIIEISRIRNSLNEHGEHFQRRIFTQNEIKYCLSYQDPAPRFAGRFAAKEAIAKALSMGFGKHLQFIDLEILPDESGKPIPYLSTKLQTLFSSPPHILLSISHCKEYALAFAIYVH